MSGPVSLSPHAPLAPAERRAVEALLRRVWRLPGARLRHLVLFGSRARGSDGPASDLDLLLVFGSLSPDREPHATWAEEAAREVAMRTGVPLEPWSVSLDDLVEGHRTPMLVDALEDGVTLWPAGGGHPRVPLTPADARGCADALLRRAREGSEEVRASRSRGDARRAALRARDDLVRLATAWVLLHGETRPRRGGAAARALELLPGGERDLRAQLRWAAGSYGRDGKEEARLHAPPPGGLAALCGAVERMYGLVERRVGRPPGGGRARAGGGTALAPARSPTRDTEPR